MRSAGAKTDDPAAASRDRRPPRIFAIMAATMFATFATLVGSYELLIA